MQLHCKDGRVLAWHDDGQAVPAGAYGEGVVVISYGGAMEALGRVGDAPPEGEPDLRPYAAPTIALSDLQSFLKAEIDKQAELLRMGLVTAGAGQAMEYQQAQSEASAALKAPSTATPAKYPMLASTIGVDVDPTTGAPAVDVLGVARSVDLARTAWLAAGAAIRGIRLAGKKAIDEAHTPTAAQDAFAAVVWSLPTQADQPTSSPGA